VKEAIRGTHDFGGSADAECTASGFFLAQAEAVPCCRFLHVPREHLRARVVRQRGQNGHPESDVFYDSDVLSCVVMVSILRFFFEDFFRTVFEKSGREVCLIPTSDFFRCNRQPALASAPRLAGPRF
jgi:hypothetical protein